MSKFITLHEPDGSSHDYRIMPFEDLTIADWYDITNPPIAPDDADASYELIRRWVRIPKAKLRRMKPADVEALMTALGAPCQTAPKRSGAMSAMGSAFKSWAMGFPGMARLSPIPKPLRT